MTHIPIDLTLPELKLLRDAMVSDARAHPTEIDVEYVQERLAYVDGVIERYPNAWAEASAP